MAKELQVYIDKCNKESGMNIQLCLDEPNAFNGFMAHYGSFKNVNNYIAIVGKKEKDFEEKSGYWGENQQKFHFSLNGDVVTAKAGLGFYTQLDLGIVKCHFEIGAQDGDWKWSD